jgi:HAD superfamily hydrolase (TIGR01490 family)
MEAAFFDLDRTVLAKASLMAYAPTFYRAGMIGKRSLAKGLWSQVLYVRRGASAATLERMRSSVLELTAGWEQAEVSRLVTAGLEAVVAPLTFVEARAALAAHRAAGRLLVIVSAAPDEIVAPLALHLGVDEAVASRAEVGPDGRYTGRMALDTHGPGKVAEMAAVARRHDVDLASSWAYSDSLTDLPMLEAVGHPVAVNPDAGLARTAGERGWPVERWTTLESAGARRPA